MNCSHISAPGFTTRGIFGLIALGLILTTAAQSHATALPAISATPLAPNNGSVNSNLQLWLTGTGIQTSGPGISGTVNGWNDAGSAVNNATAYNVGGATVAMFEQATTNNGQSFNVVNFGLKGTAGAGAFNNSTLTIGAGAGSTYFVIFETGDTNTLPNGSRLINGGTGNGMRNLSLLGSNLNGYDNNGHQGYQGNSTVNDSAYHLGVFEISPTAARSMLVDGVTQSLNPSSFGIFTPAVSSYDLGYINGNASSPIYEGNIAQVLIYNTALSSSQIANIGQYIGQQDGIFAAPVPEPSTFALAACGALGLCLAATRRRRARAAAGLRSAGRRG